MSKHLLIAQEKGAAAGFKALEQYLASPLGSSNPRMAEVREALTGNRKARFTAYCNMFLSDSTNDSTPSPSPRKGSRQGQAIQVFEDNSADNSPLTLVEQIEEARKLLVRLERQAKTASKTASKGSAVSRAVSKVTGKGKSSKSAKSASKSVVVDKSSKPRVWSAYWVEEKGFPTKVGATFTYTSAKYGTSSKHRVISKGRDGSITTERVTITR